MSTVLTMSNELLAIAVRLFSRGRENVRGRSDR